MILGYQITELIHEGLNSVIYRGVSESRRVILKVLKAEYPSLEQVARLKHEYSIIESLDLPTVVRATSLENYQNSVVLVLEDFGGVSLKHYLENYQLSIVSFLSIAVQLAQALLSLHQYHIIHKDIKPANIIINPDTHEVKLTDFSIASRLDKETLQIVNPNQLEGTLAYISPEQTGRMNRSLDYRSDFYSLGVTFYEMLTGNLPFQSDDALSIIYSHIAKQAPSLQTNLNVPPVLAAIIEKLMAKNAEDRYQSAYGLLKDLQRCLDEVKTTGEIRDFALGESDKTAQLLIPEKLYGREQEVKTLLAAFERITKEDKEDKKTNRSEVVLVSGYSGIGKSSLVHEIHKPIVQQRGFFVFGKFDQFHSTVPYAAFTQAFKSLIQQLLTLSTQELRVWKDKLLVALGANGQVIIDIIPELELIIGKLPAPVAALSFTEAQNCFNQVFRAFVDVFARVEHPLVVFIDDLQWADIASLKLMQLLLTDSDSQYLLFIGAYRDNEVSSTHVLMQTVEDIQKAGTTVNYITVKPLALECVQQLVSDALQEPLRTHHQELALLLFNKTSGNPFFLTQMLLTLYQEKLLRFDFASGCWGWELEEIQSAGIINLGVVELMSSNISKLPSTTQSALQFAACIGACFELDILAAVLDLSRILGKYWEAMQFYDAAIKNASENEFILELALASELAGEFYLSQDKTKIAKLYLSDAYYAYKKWGADAKVKHLESLYPILSTIISQPTSQLNSTKTNTTSITNTATTYKGASFDITTVVKAYQALSSEIVIDKLLFILMQLLRENAGAQKIYFLAVRQQDLYIEAVLDTDSDNAKVLQSIALTESNQLPVSLIYYVQRTCNYLLLDDGTFEIWSKDTYIHLYQPLSALIFPVINKNELVGILYLENNLIKGAFTTNHIELLSIIATQAAIYARKRTVL